MQTHEKGKRRGILDFYDVWTYSARATRRGVMLYYTGEQYSGEKLYWADSAMSSGNTMAIFKILNINQQKFNFDKMNLIF